MAFLGILLVALNLRTTTTSLSPIADAIGADIPLGSIGLALIGMIPPIAFSLSGLLGVLGARRLGLERFQVVAILLMIVGPGLRAVALDYGMLLAGTVLAFAGAGIGNILLPPLVKRYFPDRIGLVTSLYATLIAVSTGFPAALAVPVADSAGWRTSLAVWSFLALVSLLPWIAVLAQHRRERLALSEDAVQELEVPKPAVIGRIWRSRTAWTIALLFSMSSFQAYSNFAWLPLLLADTAGVNALGAGALLSVFAFMGIPASLLTPILTARMRNVGWIVHIGVAGFILGYLGLLIVPDAATILWVGLAGFGQVLFPACLVLINLRTRTHDGSVALSGFVQGVGYAIGALGPLAVGVLHELTGGWIAALWLLILSAAVCIPLGVLLRDPVYIEDELGTRQE